MKIAVQSDFGNLDDPEMTQRGYEIHWQRRFCSRIVRVMLGMIFAAGLGQRLLPLSNELPKPAMPLGHHPMAVFALRHLHQLGVNQVLVNTHHLAEKMKSSLQPWIPPGLEVIFSHETELLGTAGGLKRALHVLKQRHGEDVGPDQEIVVMNGDAFFWPDLTRAISVHRQHDSVATMVLRTNPDPARYSSVVVNAHEEVRSVRGVPNITAHVHTQANMFTGTQVLSLKAIESLPGSGCLVAEGYQRWLKEGQRVMSVVDDAPWRDLGTVYDYWQANIDWAQGALEIKDCAPPRTFPDCVIAPDVHVAQGVTLERVVAWPGSYIQHSLHDAVVTPTQIVSITQT